METFEFFDEPKALTDAHKQALARMYADPHLRDYLENSMRVANQNAMLMLEAQKIAEASAYASRYKSIRQLLAKGREYFIHFDKVRKIKEPLRALE